MTRDERSLFTAAFDGYPTVVSALVRRGTDVERAKAWEAIVLGWNATDHRTPTLPYFTHGDDLLARQRVREVLEPLVRAGMRTDDRQWVDGRLLEVLDELRAGSLRTAKLNSEVAS